MQPTAQPAFLTGRTLGHHSILEPLGEGGMGCVYKARDTRLGRLVALKVLRPERVGDEAHRRRFLREAQAAAALNHPNIITVHEIGFDAGLDYIVMEHIAGGTLADLIAAGRLPIERVLRLMAQVADALAAAHAEGIVHRDLKPSNVMLASPDHLKVVDFGLAKFIEDARPSGSDPSTWTGALMGTPAYVAPEQIRGLAADTRCDVWASGVMLYEMATGARPYPETNPLLLLHEILSRQPRPPRTLNPEVPLELEAIILKALERDPAHRYQSARQLGDDLERLSAGTPPLAKHRPHFRSRVAAAGLTVVLLSAMAGGSYFLRPRAGRAGRPSNARGAESTSIAVLPFVNLSADPDQEYFSDGLSEELLSRVGRIPGLRVVGRTSSFRFKGRTEDLRSIGEQLQVGKILEGSVRREGRRVRIAARLVNGADGFRLWSETYDRELDDIFAVQDEIARSVADALKVTLLGERPASQQTKNTDAYDALLLAEHCYAHPNRENLERARISYEKATELDPGYAQAWAGLGAALAFQASAGFIPTEEGFRKARVATQRALDLDQDLAYAHKVMGWIRMSYDWDWSGATASFQRALALDPRQRGRDAALLSAALGHPDEALALARRGVEQEPLDADSHYVEALLNYYAGHLDLAEAGFNRVRQIAPERSTTHAMLALTYLAQSRIQDALPEVEREEDAFWRLPVLSVVQHALGRAAESEAALTEFIAEHQAVGAYQIASVYAYRGQPGPAIEWLERAYAQRDGGLFLMKVDPLLSSLRGDRRFDALLKRMRLS